MRLRAVVIGLGRVGSRFDEEPGRQAVWSHVGAYLALPERYELVGAAEPDADNRAAFARRCPGIPVFDDAESLIRSTDPDVVSICTPSDTHERVLDLAAGAARLKAVWCEKPIAPDELAATRMVARARTRNVPLVVSHVRRWLPLWRRMRDIIKSRTLGELACLRVAMPNRLYSIGSHQIDLALFLGGSAAAVRGMRLPFLEQGGEPSIAGMLMLESGAYTLLQVAGKRDNLVIEAEALCANGRVYAREDRSEIAIERFADSRQYAQYRQLGRTEIERAAGFGETSPFVAIAGELAELCAGRIRRPSCSGADALQVQQIIAALENDAAAPIRRLDV